MESKLKDNYFSYVRPGKNDVKIFFVDVLQWGNSLELNINFIIEIRSVNPVSLYRSVAMILPIW